MAARQPRGIVNGKAHRLRSLLFLHSLEAVVDDCGRSLSAMLNKILETPIVPSGGQYFPSSGN